MKFNVRGNKVELTDSIRDYTIEKIGKLDKYLEDANEITANVLIKVDGINQIVEVTIPIKKMILRAEANSKDLYASIDIVLDKLERQIRKNKARVHKIKENIFQDFKVNEEEAKIETIVKRKEIDDKPMSEEEAILQMNLLGHEFYLFKDMETLTPKVVYRRRDKNFGVIEMK